MIYDALANDSMLAAHVRPGALLVPAGKRPGQRVLTQEEIDSEMDRLYDQMENFEQQ